MPRKPKVGYLVNFKKAKLPTKQKLVGKYSILEPVDVKNMQKTFIKIIQKIKKLDLDLSSLWSI